MKPYYETILNHIKPPFSILFQRFTDQTAPPRPPPPVVPRVFAALPLGPSSRPQPPGPGGRWNGRWWCGYGSIPINTIFSGMNIHKSQLFWCSPGVPGFWLIAMLIYGLLWKITILGEQSPMESSIWAAWPTAVDHMITWSLGYDTCDVSWACVGWCNASLM